MQSAEEKKTWICKRIQASSVLWISINYLAFIVITVYCLYIIFNEYVHFQTKMTSSPILSPLSADEIHILLEKVQCCKWKWHSESELNEATSAMAGDCMRRPAERPPSTGAGELVVGAGSGRNGGISGRWGGRSRGGEEADLFAMAHQI